MCGTRSRAQPRGKLRFYTPPFNLKTIVVSVATAVATVEHLPHGAKVPAIPAPPIKPVEPNIKTEHIEVAEPAAQLALLEASQYGGTATAHVRLRRQAAGQVDNTLLTRSLAGSSLVALVRVSPEPKQKVSKKYPTP